MREMRYYLEKRDSEEQRDVNSTELLNQEQEEENSQRLVSCWFQESRPFPDELRLFFSVGANLLIILCDSFLIVTNQAT